MKLVTKPLDTASDNFAEVVACLMTIGWGVILALPNGSFGVSRAYDHMAALAPAYWWGVVAIVLGLGTLHSYIMEWYNTVITLSTGLVLFWSIVAVMFVTAAPATTITPLYIGLALMFGWIAAKEKAERDS